MTDPPSSATRCELAAIGDTSAELVLARFATPETPLWQFVFPREPVLCQSCASPGLPEQRFPCAGSLLSGRKTTSQCLRCRACLQIVQLRGLPKNLLALTRRNDAKANPGCCEARSDYAINLYASLIPTSPASLSMLLIVVGVWIRGRVAETPDFKRDQRRPHRNAIARGNAALSCPPGHGVWRTRRRDHAIQQHLGLRAALRNTASLHQPQRFPGRDNDRKSRFPGMDSRVRRPVRQDGAITPAISTVGVNAVAIYLVAAGALITPETAPRR